MFISLLPVSSAGYQGSLPMEGSTVYTGSAVKEVKAVILEQ